MKRDSAEKFEIFTKVCGVVFILLILVKLFVINISWLIVLIPIMWELGLFNGNL